MRNKKYRPVKLWIIMFFFVVLFALIGFLLLKGWKKIAMLSVAGLLLVSTIVTLTFYIEAKKESLIIGHGLWSKDKRHRSSFTIKTIPIKDIAGLELIRKGRAIVINLKDGNHVIIPIGGYLNRLEIIRLVYDIKKQLEEGDYESKD